MSDKREKKEKPEEELDTQTTFADMNVEGFRWYDPSVKNGKTGDGKIQLTRKEKRAIFKAAVMAVIPVVGVVSIAFIVVYLLARIWLF